MGKSYKRNDGRYLSAEQVVVDEYGTILSDALDAKQDAAALSKIIGYKDFTVSVSLSAGFNENKAANITVPSGYTKIGMFLKTASTVDLRNCTILGPTNMDGSNVNIYSQRAASGTITIRVIYVKSAFLGSV